MSKIIQLPISTNYVNHWGFWEAAREILQNAIDQGQYFVEDLEEQGVMKITSQDTKLKLSSLMLGESTKSSDDTKIGKYGEGYKLALLVLCRMGFDVVIRNGNDCWNVFIEKHDVLDADCLNIKVTEDVYLDDLNVVSFNIRGLEQEHFSEIREKFIDLSVTGQGHTVMAEYNGSRCFEYKRGANKKIFVGGLYVCDLSDEYHYSWDFAPNVLALDRDRNKVETFYLEYYATQILSMSGNIELLTSLANNNAKDISDYYQDSSYVGSGGSSSKHREEVARFALSGFIEKHGEKAYPIDRSSNDDSKRILTEKCISKGLLPVTVSSALYNMLPDKLKSKISTTKVIGKISDALQELLDRNVKHMRAKPKKELTEFIQSLKIEGK